MDSSGAAAVARHAAEDEAGGFRQQVLATARRFKSSWVELGALLVQVRDRGRFQEWGFATFEEYCSKELRIKKQTAWKLTNSYGFLAKHERSAMERFESQPDVVAREVPAFEVVSVLAGAEERGQLDERGYEALREQIWNDERPPNQVARELAQRFPPPAKPPPPVDLALRRLVQSARRLVGELRACSRVPEALSERADALVADLEQLAEDGEATKK